jgi:hypothetical protein
MPNYLDYIYLGTTQLIIRGILPKKTAIDLVVIFVYNIELIINNSNIIIIVTIDI